MNKNKGMNTGGMPKVTMNLNTKAGQQKIIGVNASDMSTQSNSRSRGGFMDLKGGIVVPQDSQFK